MNKRLNVLMVYPEIAPFVKTNDIAEVGGALPRVLKEMGHYVRLITPQYRVINERKYILRDVIRLQNIKVPLGSEHVEINVKSAFVPDSKVQVYFIDYKPFFARNGVYTDPDTGQYFKDNDERFILFTWGILATLKKLQWQPDVIHCNGWQSGLIPLFLKTIYKDDEFFKNVSTMFTVHDIGAAGSFKQSCIDKMSLGDESDTVRDLVSNKKFNFTKAGLAYSDKINTVSQELYDIVKSDKGDAEGLARYANRKDRKFSIIPPGAGTEIWDPETDKLITQPFSASTVSDRRINRSTLLETLDVTLEDTVPIIMIREEDSGLDFIQFMLKQTDKTEKIAAYFLYACTSDIYADEIAKTVKRTGSNTGVIKMAKKQDIHQVFAGIDFSLCRSDYPLSGMTVLRGLRYGVVPIVYDVAGIKGLLKPVTKQNENGNSFIIDKLTQDNVFRAIKFAVKTFSKENVWEKVVTNTLNSSLTWAEAVKLYVADYSNCSDMA